MDFSILSVLIFIWNNLDFSDSIQCYSCKASGVNELDANIKCLENAYLENCAEFYHYYNEIEGQTLPGDDYYYYDTPGQKGQGLAGQGQGGGKAGEGVANQGLGGPRSAGDPPGSRPGGDLPARPRRRRAARTKQNKSEEESEERRAEDKKEAEEYEYEYEYEYDDENADNLDFNAKNKSGFVRPKGPAEEAKDDHYCYNMATKSTWENYVVEKGCKRIAYCKNNLANKPEWGNPWNFCCDKSRCNVKLVKDKPQRVFGMGCRRTDDCIQGHTSRPICPEFFKTCPKLSTSLVKMECRVQARTMASVKKGTKFRHMFRDKKCYCAKGYYPKGPICTSGATNITYHWALLTGCVSQILMAVYLHL